MPSSASASAALAATGDGSLRAPAASISARADPLTITLPRVTARSDFSSSPFYFTAAFDGSMRFALWQRMLQLARTMRTKHGAMPHFTFFVNACYYTTDPGASDVGKAMTRTEVLVRRALTQQAINEGHDIADHGMGHHDGREWSKEQWLGELARFHEVMDNALFEPVLDDEAGFVFPKFSPLASAQPRQAGAACEDDAGCDSGRCLALTARTMMCAQACNSKLRCPQGLACGAPMFRDDTDVCLPPPVFPVEHEGKLLFNATGEPNLKHPRLKRYRIQGFRAPYLGANDALYEALAERGYVYDTSQSGSPGPPFYLLPRGSEKRVLEFALMLHPGALAIPMDYSYARVKAPRERMASDYENGILGSYAMGRIPWNVGHHFALWEDGAYLETLETAVDSVLGGCPDAAGNKRCEGGEVVSFRELAQRLE